MWNIFSKFRPGWHRGINIALSNINYQLYSLILGLDDVQCRYINTGTLLHCPIKYQLSSQILGSGWRRDENIGTLLHYTIQYQLSSQKIIRSGWCRGKKTYKYTLLLYPIIGLFQLSSQILGLDVEVKRLIPCFIIGKW